MATEYNYDLQINEISKRNNISLHRARTILKSYRRVLKEDLKQGKRVEVPNLASMFLSTRSAKNQFFGEEAYSVFDDQVLAVSDEVQLDALVVYTILGDYIRLLHSKLMLGYRITIAGVFHINPYEVEDGTIAFETVISQSLEKPDSFTLIEKVGNEAEVEHVIPKEKQIYRLILLNTLELPKRVHRPLSDLNDAVRHLDDSLFS